MFSPSDEQQQIIDWIKDRKNVYVNACAGSGKSTTILACAKQIPVQFMQITYNKSLRKEFQASILKYGISNIYVHTYHSLAYHYFGREGQTDEGIRLILREKRAPTLPFINVLVIDEAQDMTRLYYDFVAYFLSFQKDVVLCILGDEKQGLYDFKGADTRFLTYAPACWKHHKSLLTPHFEYGTLRTSYRITHPMAQFVNKVLLEPHEKKMNATKDGPSVLYIRRDYNMMVRTIVGQIVKLIREEQAKFDDIFILGGSIKENSFLRKIENGLVEQNIPCYVPMVDQPEELDIRIMANKIAFSTFHTAKGRQRKYVFVIGFDHSYFLYNARNHPIHRLPHTIYVACTRAMEKLYVFENSDVRPFAFLQMSHVQMQKELFLQFQGTPCVQFPSEKPSEPSKKINTTPTELIRFMSEETYEQITVALNNLFILVQPASDALSLDSLIETKDGFEDVSDLNGTVLPLLFFDRLMGTAPILPSLIAKAMVEIPYPKHSYLHGLVLHMPTTCQTVQEYLYLTNLYVSIQQKLYSKIKQIPLEECKWISEDTVQKASLRIANRVADEKPWKAEHVIIKSSSDADHIHLDSCLFDVMPEQSRLRFTARVDLMTENCIWEFKCTGNLHIEHKLQLLLYCWLYQMVNRKKKRGFLFNVKTDECFELTGDLSQWTPLVKAIIRGKFIAQKKLTDEEFLDQFL